MIGRRTIKPIPIMRSQTTDWTIPIRSVSQPVSRDATPVITKVAAITGAIAKGPTWKRRANQCEISGPVKPMAKPLEELMNTTLTKSFPPYPDPWYVPLPDFVQSFFDDV